MSLALLAIAIIIVLGSHFVDPLAVVDPMDLRWIGDWAGKVSRFGKSGWLLWPIAVLLLLSLIAMWRAAIRADRQIFSAISARLLFLLTAIALPGLVASLIKPLAGRVRPKISPDPFTYEPLAFFREMLGGSIPFPEYVYGSMPSGHTTTAFAAAVALGLLLPRLSPLFYALAAIMGATRLLIGVHYVTDVIAGAALGAFGALAVRNYFAARRWVFSVDEAGTVRPMPGPDTRRILRALGRVMRGAQPRIVAAAENGGLAAEVRQ